MMVQRLERNDIPVRTIYATTGTAPINRQNVEKWWMLQLGNTQNYTRVRTKRRGN